MRLLNTLYVATPGSKVKAEKQALRVRSPDGSARRVPLASLEAVILVGRGEITAEAMARCVERDIRIAALRRSGRVRFVVGGSTSGNVLLRVAQYEATRDPSIALPLVRCLVAGKLQNCRRAVSRWARDADTADRAFFETVKESIERGIRALPEVDENNRLRGFEGDATRWYFKALARHVSRRSGFEFEGRERRPPRGRTNALLSFIYSLLLVEAVGALDAVGLDPQIGFLHGLRPGRPSLALDLIEEFRPALGDRFVARMILRREIAEADLQVRPGGVCHLTDDGRRTVLRAWEQFKDEGTTHPLLDKAVPRWSLIPTQATILARHLRGDLPVYAPYVDR